MNIATQCMGLAMPNPIIAASSPLTENINAVKKTVEAGVGAVVLKSLFEEDIAAAVEKGHSSMAYAYPEEAAYAEEMQMMLEPDSYLSFVEESASTVDVPVIASLNCYSSRWWVDFAERISRVGAAGIELNISPIAMDAKTTSRELENKVVEMVALARKTVDIPLAVKLGPNFTSLTHLAKRLEKAGANALTLFNRYYKVDIDIDEIEFKAENSLSVKEEFGTVLRWVGILSDLTEMDIFASTGIYSARELIKALLAGAQSVQLCSVVLRQGRGVIKEILSGLSEWMSDKNFQNLDSFRSLLSVNDDQRNQHFQRLQYVKSLKGS